MSSELNPRALAKQNQIRTAAQHLFLKNGFSATSMDMISAEANVSKQTLYNYYPSKEDLLVNVLQQLIHHLSEDSLAVSDLPLHNLHELQQVLQQLAQTFVTTLMQPDYLALTRVILSEVTRFPQLGELFRSTVPHRVLQSIAALLQKAHEKGLLEIEDTEIAARMFVGPFFTYVMLDGLLVTDQRPQPPDAKKIAKITDSYMRTIILAS